MKSRMLVHVSMDMNIQKDVHKQITNAFELYKNGEYRNSLQVAEQIYSKAPSNVDNHILLASIQFQLRNLSAAIFYCQQAIRVEPNCAEAFCIMGNCLKEMNDLGSAVNFFHKSIRFNPRFADVYNNLGLALFLSPGNKTKESLEAFQVAASLDPSHCDSLCNIGTVSKMLGRNNFAKEKYLEAIRIQPQCAIAWSNLGGIFVNHGDYSQAVNCYRHALNVMPNFPDALSNSGNAIFKLGKEDSNNAALVERVAERYEKALSLRPDFALSRACYGLFCFKTGMKSKEDAMKQLRIAILQDDTCFDAMNNLAALYFESGRLDDSLKLLLRVLKRKPEHWCAFNNLGNVLREMVSECSYGTILR
jgi:protein O-GlcNAc transferase